MKSLKILSLTALCLLLLSVSVFAATATRVNTTNIVNDNIVKQSTVYDVKINFISWFDKVPTLFHYVFTNELDFDTLQSLNMDPTLTINKIVNNEILLANIETYLGKQINFSLLMNPSLQYWQNVAAWLNQTNVVPGRTTYLSSLFYDGQNQMTYIDEGLFVKNDDGTVTAKNRDRIGAENTYNNLIATAPNESATYKDIVLSETSSSEYIYVDGELIQKNIINRDLNKVTVHNISGMRYCSPLVLDIKGTGTLEASNGQYLPHSSVDFKNTVVTDFYGDGFEVAMEWVGPNDGLLVAPKADGSVDMSCLFGVAGGFDNGFEKLSLYADENGIVRGDALNKLAVWQDVNGNAIADKGEVKTCSELGITSINANHKLFASSFVMNGKTHKMWDWWPNAAELRTIAVK